MSKGTALLFFILMWVRVLLVVLAAGFLYALVRRVLIPRLARTRLWRAVVEPAWGVLTGYWLVAAVVLVAALGTYLSRTARSNIKGRPVHLILTGMVGSEEGRKRVRASLGEFEDAYPEIEVEFRELPVRARNKMLVQIAGNVAADVMVVHYSFFPDFCERGAFLPIDEYLERDREEVRLDDFYEIGIKSYAYQGRQYGLPMRGSALTMFYNKALFDRYGVPYPKGDWTWEEFREICRRLTHDDDDDGYIDCYGFEVSSDYKNWLPWMWTNGGDWVSDDLSRFTFDTPQAREACQFLVDMMLKDRCAVPEQASLRMSVRDPFYDEKFAIKLAGPWMYARYLDEVDFDWGVVPMPRRKRDEPSRCRYAGVGMVISRTARHPDEAWELVKWLAGERVAIPLMELGEDIAARRSINEPVIKGTSTFACRIGPEHMKVFVDVTRSARPYQQIPMVQEAILYVSEYLDLLVNGKIEVDRACMELDRKLNEVMVRKRREMKILLGED